MRKAYTWLSRQGVGCKEGSTNLPRITRGRNERMEVEEVGSVFGRDHVPGTWKELAPGEKLAWVRPLAVGHWNQK